ncbi:MAG: hypothetical protein ACYS7Y_30520 [Planctomycetota bacterium]
MSDSVIGEAGRPAHSPGSLAEEAVGSELCSGPGSLVRGGQDHDGQTAVALDVMQDHAVPGLTLASVIEAADVVLPNLLPGLQLHEGLGGALHGPAGLHDSRHARPVGPLAALLRGDVDDSRAGLVQLGDAADGAAHDATLSDPDRNMASRAAERAWSRVG